MIKNRFHHPTKKTLNEAVRKRITDVEALIETQLSMVANLQENQHSYELHQGLAATREKQEREKVRLKDLIDEHAVLESILDRSAARRWRWLQLLQLAGLSAIGGSLFQALIGKLLAK